MEKIDTDLAQLDNCIKTCPRSQSSKVFYRSKSMQYWVSRSHLSTPPSNWSWHNIYCNYYFSGCFKQKRYRKMHNGNGQMKEVINLQRKFVSYNRKNLTRWTQWFLCGKYHNLSGKIFRSKRNEKCSCWDKNCWLCCCKFCCGRKLLI